MIVGSETPGMQAQNLIREIKKKKTSLSVAWITGSVGTEAKGKEKGPAADLLIRKPIDMTSTLEKLSELLAGSMDSPYAPLADRMRPRTIEEMVGQNHLLGPGSVALLRAIQSGRLFSVILWGPPRIR